MIAAYRSQIRPGGTLRFASNAVVAGDTDFVDFAAILTDLRPLHGWTVFNSPWVTDAQMDDRVALNDLLLGFDRSSFEVRQREFFDDLHCGPSWRDRSLIPVFLATRLAAYDRAAPTFPQRSIDSRYVTWASPRAPDLFTCARAALLSGGPTWDVWERITNSHP